MLRAGVMTAGQMDVDRRVERDARFAPARDFLGMAFGVGGGEFAAGIAGTGDEAGTNGFRLDGKTERFDPLPGGLGIDFPWFSPECLEVDFLGFLQEVMWM